MRIRSHVFATAKHGNEDPRSAQRDPSEHGNADTAENIVKVSLRFKNSDVTKNFRDSCTFENVSLRANQALLKSAEKNNQSSMELYTLHYISVYGFGSQGNRRAMQVGLRTEIGAQLIISGSNSDCKTDEGSRLTYKMFLRFLSIKKFVLFVKFELSVLKINFCTFITLITLPLLSLFHFSTLYFVQ